MCFFLGAPEKKINKKDFPFAFNLFFLLQRCCLFHTVLWSQWRCWCYTMARNRDRNQVSTGWTFVSVSLTNLQHSVRGERCFLLWNHVWSSEFCVDFKVIVAITHRQAAWQQLHQTRYCLKNNVNASHAFVYGHQKDVIILQNLSHIYFTTSNKCHIYKSFALLCWHKMESWTTTSFFIN